MKTVSRNPRKWRLSTLLSLGTEQVHMLACQVIKANTSFRVILGRCLLALEESGGHKSFGCSTAIHYAIEKLGTTKRVAWECRRVAKELLDLPALTLAAEEGDITWSKLRSITRVASLETEQFWLKLSKERNAEQIRQLVKLTPEGGLPGDVDVEKSCTTEFRIVASPEVIQLFRRARQMFSIEQDKALDGAETLELLLANFFSTQPMDPEVLEQLRDEADLDLRAERARLLPEVIEAREMAAEIEETVEEVECAEELLERAIGAPVSMCSSRCCSNKLPRGVGPQLSESELLERLKLELEAWKNNKLRYNPLNRFATKAQKKELYRRDGWQCSRPGCPHQVWLHIHHIRPYSEGGKTTRDNLICLCTACHSNLHAGLLRIEVQANGKLLFIDKEGNRLDFQADAELAHWLDFFFGWHGTEEDSHLLKHARCEWSVFGT